MAVMRLGDVESPVMRLGNVDSPVMRLGNDVESPVMRLGNVESPGSVISVRYQSLCQIDLFEIMFEYF